MEYSPSYPSISPFIEEPITSFITGLGAHLVGGCLPGFLNHQELRHSLLLFSGLLQLKLRLGQLLMNLLILFLPPFLQPGNSGLFEEIIPFPITKMAGKSPFLNRK